MRRYRWEVITVLAVLLILAAGCKNYKVHPGAAGQFDSKSYDALLVAHAAIEQAKAEYKANPAINEKYVNDAVAAYNVARSSYLTYHNAALAGGNSAVLETNLARDLAGMTAAIAELERQLGAKLP